MRNVTAVVMTFIFIASVESVLRDQTSTRSRVPPSHPPYDGILFVDHFAQARSGHLGHALVEYEPGKILAFYPNCSDDQDGHSAVGWREFKRSKDGGITRLQEELSAWAQRRLWGGQRPHDPLHIH